MAAMPTTSQIRTVIQVPQVSKPKNAPKKSQESKKKEEKDVKPQAKKRNQRKRKAVSSDSESESSSQFGDSSSSESEKEQIIKRKSASRSFAIEAPKFDPWAKKQKTGANQQSSTQQASKPADSS